MVLYKAHFHVPFSLMLKDLKGLINYILHGIFQCKIIPILS